MSRIEITDSLNGRVRCYRFVTKSLFRKWGVLEIFTNYVQFCTTKADFCTWRCWKLLIKSMYGLGTYVASKEQKYCFNTVVIKIRSKCRPPPHTPNPKLENAIVFYEFFPKINQSYLFWMCEGLFVISNILVTFVLYGIVQKSLNMRIFSFFWIGRWRHFEINVLLTVVRKEFCTKFDKTQRILQQFCFPDCGFCVFPENVIMLICKSS